MSPSSKKPKAVRISTRLHSTRDERITRINEGRKERLKLGRKQHEEDITRKWSEIPQGEFHAIQQVFERFDEDGTGILDRQGLMKCLLDLGLGGASSLEKHEVWHILEETLSSTGGENITDEGSPKEGAGVVDRRNSRRTSSCFSEGSKTEAVCADLLTLSVKIVPRVRERLVEMQSDDLMRNFSLFDTNGMGRLTIDQCLQVARSIGVDAMMFKTAYDVRRCEERQGVDYEELTQIVAYCRQQAERSLREAEHTIKMATGLGDKLFHELRKDILNLWDIFRFCDTHRTGRMPARSLAHALGQVGLLPRDMFERTELRTVMAWLELKEDSPFSFEELALIVRELRRRRTERKQEELKASFNRYDRDSSGTLTGAEIGALLADAGLQPQSRKEQLEFASLIQSVDLDHNGHLDFDEFRALVSRVDERVKSMRCDLEIERALCLGFSEDQLCDLRYVFQELDVDGSGLLAMSEVKVAMSLLEKQVSMEAFDYVFREVDRDKSGELDFIEFIEFIQLLRDRENIFADEGFALPSKLKFLDQRIIRVALQRVGCDKSHVRSLTRDQTFEEFTFHFGVQLNENLQERLKITTVAELLQHASDLAASRADARAGQGAGGGGGGWGGLEGRALALGMRSAVFG